METEKVRFIGGPLSGKYVDIPKGINYWNCEDFKKATFNEGVPQYLYIRKYFKAGNGAIVSEFHLS